MGHFSPPSPPLCYSLIGEEWERKAGRGGIIWPAQFCISPPSAAEMACFIFFFLILFYLILGFFLSLCWHHAGNVRDKSCCVRGCMWAGEESIWCWEVFPRGLQQGWATGLASQGERVCAWVKGWGGRGMDIGEMGRTTPCLMPWHLHQLGGGQCHHDGIECPKSRDHTAGDTHRDAVPMLRPTSGQGMMGARGIEITYHFPTGWYKTL